HHEDESIVEVPGPEVDCAIVPYAQRGLAIEIEQVERCCGRAVLLQLFESFEELLLRLLRLLGELRSILVATRVHEDAARHDAVVVRQTSKAIDDRRRSLLRSLAPRRIRQTLEHDGAASLAPHEGSSE